MTHKLPDLPYAMDALVPHISRETLEYHHGKHHAKYVSTLNDLIKGTEFENMPLESIIKTASGPVFNNAAQAWNHAFYWNSLSPEGGGVPDGALAGAIDSQFGSFEAFRKEFTRAATQLFGSGWCWLAKNKDGSLSIESTPNAGTPLTSNQLPLLTCDVWEHAYYIDYRNARAKYIDAFWNLANWRLAAEKFSGEPVQKRESRERRGSPAHA